jgi:hypothetical protein
VKIGFYDTLSGILYRTVAPCSCDESEFPLSLLPNLGLLMIYEGLSLADSFEPLAASRAVAEV